MKTLITILFVLLAVGCGDAVPEQDGQTDPTYYDEIKTVDPGEKNTWAKPVKELTIKDVAGAYVMKSWPCRMVLLENGVMEFYENGKKLKGDNQWYIEGKEVYIEDRDGYAGVFRINSDTAVGVISLTDIARIDKDGNRIDRGELNDAGLPPPLGPWIKERVHDKAPSRELTPEEKVVGTYQSKSGKDPHRMALLASGLVENWWGDIKLGGKSQTWKTVGKEIHIDRAGTTTVYRINPDESITSIAIVIGKQKATGQESTYKKIK